MLRTCGTGCGLYLGLGDCHDSFYFTLALHDVRRKIGRSIALSYTFNHDLGSR